MLLPVLALLPLVPSHAAATTTTPTAAMGISRHGATLLLNGAPHYFAGVNAPEVTGNFRINHGCGYSVGATPLKRMFAALPPGSLVRINAYQQMAVNDVTHRWDWSQLDGVVADAAAAHQYLVLVLSSQTGTCDNDLWHDAAWYAGGYRTAWSDGGRNLVSYAAWVKDVVTRYRSSPAVGMWEPVSEPDVSSCRSLTQQRTGNCYGGACPANAASTLKGFFTAIAGEIRGIDPRHLIASGLIGTWQCGSHAADYRTVGSSPGIDVLDYHDYGNDTQAVPAELTPLIAAAARALGKPLITEEAGILAGGSCHWTAAQRAALVASTMAQQRRAGVQGFLVWDWTPVATVGCTYDVAPADPTMHALASAA